MSVDSLNAAPPPSTTTETRSSAASAAAPKQRTHKGPAVGFEALLAVLTAALDQTAAVQDATGKLAAPGPVALAGADGKAAAKDAAEEDASKKDSAGDAATDSPAILADPTAIAAHAAASAQNAAQEAAATVSVTLTPVAVQTPPTAAAPAKAAPAGETATTQQALAADLPAVPLKAAPPPLAGSAGNPPEPAADAAPKAIGLSTLDPGPATAPVDPAMPRLDVAEPKASPSPAQAGPLNAAPANAAPAQAAAPAPAVIAESQSPAPGAAAPVLAEAAQAAPPAPRDSPKDSKGSSRYARNEVERSRAAQATVGSPASGSAISAKMGDVAQSATGAQAEAFALTPAFGEDAKDVAPAALTASPEGPEPAAPGGDLNTATSNTTAPATVTHAAALVVRGEPQTVANLAAQIVKKLDGRSTRFDVALDPVGLGHVEVRVEIGAHGRMTAAMAFDTPQAAAELRARAGELKTALEQAGFDISGGLSFDVAADSGQSRGSAGQDHQPAPVFRGRAFQTALDTSADPAPGRAFQYRRSSASGVDIRI